jgi:DNA-binding MarR family transcriptional regulator
MVVGVELTTLVSLTAPALDRTVLDRLAALGFDGVRVSHGYVVQRLLEGEPTISELADALGMTQQGASKQVLDLERLGYAERVPVPGDQRARAVRLTQRGRAMVAATRRVRADLEAEVVGRVGERRAAAARGALEALVDVLGLTERVRTRTVPEV